MHQGKQFASQPEGLEDRSIDHASGINPLHTPDIVFKFIALQDRVFQPYSDCHG